MPCNRLATGSGSRGYRGSRQLGPVGRTIPIRQPTAQRDPVEPVAYATARWLAGRASPKTSLSGRNGRAPSSRAGDHRSPWAASRTVPSYQAGRHESATMLPRVGGQERPSDAAEGKPRDGTGGRSEASRVDEQRFCSFYSREAGGRRAVELEVGSVGGMGKEGDSANRARGSTSRRSRGHRTGLGYSVGPQQPRSSHASVERQGPPSAPSLPPELAPTARVAPSRIERVLRGWEGGRRRGPPRVGLRE